LAAFGLPQGRSGVLRTFCLWVLTKGHAKSCSGYCQSPRMAEPIVNTIEK
jgi:hypothetical protein